MASACVLQWAPDSLYNTAISATVANYSVFRKDIQNLTESVQFDIFYKLYMKGNLYTLGTDLAEIDNFAKILKVLDKRCLLHHCFQALIDHGAQVNEILANEFCKRYQLSGHLNENERNKAIQLGTALASFFNESGWFFSSERVYHTCRLLCDQDKTYSGLCKLLECNVRLLHVQNSSCKYREANETFKETFKILNILNQANISVNKAMLYGECCGLFFAESQYDQAYKYCNLAVQQLTPVLSPRTIIDVLRQCAKTLPFIFNENLFPYNNTPHSLNFTQPSLALAVTDASHPPYLPNNKPSHRLHPVTYEHFGQRHPKYADTLQDYGFYLLNVDSVAASVKVYQMALDIRLSVFGGNNFHVAVAHEDLAYASYVHEYSSGNFKDAQRHAEKAIEILLKILPSDHLLLSSSKRLAETHHLKAIEIKERLLGPDDYEVALSVGHLASLYNYDMKYHMEAESLYKRSIEIGKKLFGAGYSGLEYDYKGLLRLYQSQGDRENMLHYSRILQDWNRIRDHTNAIEVKPLDFSLDLSVQDLHKYVFNS
eukprot:XP_014790608.1 PREDICTED: amyloid protein-binding protein 2-like [Octopus bimaculoides]